MRTYIFIVVRFGHFGRDLEMSATCFVWKHAWLGVSNFFFAERALACLFSRLPFLDARNLMFFCDCSMKIFPEFKKFYVGDCSVPVSAIFGPKFSTPGDQGYPKIFETCANYADV